MTSSGREEFFDLDGGLNILAKLPYNGGICFL
jgi:hypothetical protein